MLIFLILLICCVYLTPTSLAVNDESESSLLYLAYGSNLCLERLNRTTTANRTGIGLINNYRLDFDHFSNRWKGHVATIVPQPGEQVWVGKWKVTNSSLELIDKQEGVDENIYKRILVTVEDPKGNKQSGYTYTLVKNPTKYFPLDKLPPSRQPSLLYLNTIIKGAKEFDLPQDYQRMLQSIANNGFDKEGDTLY